MARLNKNLIVSNISNRYLGQKNFQGEARRFNEAGKRNFYLYLDDPNATYRYGDTEYPVGDPSHDADGYTALDRFIMDLKQDGWHVKQMPSNEEKGYEGHPYIKVLVNLHPPVGQQPKVCFINRSGKAVQVPDEELDSYVSKIGTQKIVDWANIAVTPCNYNWRDGGNDQSAYASVMYFKFLETDVWAEQYE